MKGALLRYRVLANVVGVLLVILVPIGIPLQVAGHPGLVHVVGAIHGIFYVVYLVSAFELSRRAKISFVRMVVIFLAGLVPFATFVVERKVTRDVQSQL